MWNNKKPVPVLLTLSVCLVFVLFLGCFGTASKGFKFPSSQWEGEKKVYEKHGIKVQYPATWSLESHVITRGTSIGKSIVTVPCHRIGFFASEPGFTGFVVGVSIQPESYAPAGDFEKLRQELLREFRGYEESKILFTENSTYGNYHSFDIVFRGKEHPEQEFFFQNWLRFIKIDSSITYRLSYSSTDKDFDKFLPEAKFIIESIRFVDTTGIK